MADRDRLGSLNPSTHVATHLPRPRRNQLYATVSVSGDAVVIEENEEEEDEEEDSGPKTADPRLAAVRWRRRQHRGLLQQQPASVGEAARGGSSPQRAQLE